MKKKLALLLGVALCMTAALAGCGKEEVKKADTAKIETEEEEVLRILGEKKADAYVLNFENQTGQEIKEVKVRAAGTEAWTELLTAAADEDPIAKAETVELCYAPETTATTDTTTEGTEAAAAETDAAAEGTEGDGSRFAVQDTWEVSLTLADDKVYQLTSFPFEDAEAVIVKVEDDVAFLEYESKESKETVNTKEQELAVKARAAAEAQAAAEAAAAAEAQAQQYSEPAYTEPAYEAPVYETPSYEAPAQNSEGCLQ